MDVGVSVYAATKALNGDFSLSMFNAFMYVGLSSQGEVMYQRVVSLAIFLNYYA